MPSTERPLSTTLPVSGEVPAARFTPAVRGAMFGLTAYLLWGLMPLFMHQLAGRMSTMLILSHRVVWSVAILVVLVTLLKLWRPLLAVVRTPRTMAMLLASTLLVSCNWATFTYVSTHGQVLQAALGYFLNPIFSALLGAIVLRERLRSLQWAAVVVALAGVTYLAVARQIVPKEALALAVSWSLYGLVRKLAPVDAIAGLTIETSLLFPLALGWMLVAGPTGIEGRDTLSPGLLVYLVIGCGVFTTIPLLCFSRAAKLLPLSTLGFLQYVGPTCQFLCAVVLLGEKFTTAHAVAFGLIWTGVAMFVTDAVIKSRRPAAGSGAGPATAPANAPPE